MGSIRLIAVVMTILLGLTSCSRDPNVVKKRYLESGNKYFENGRYKEASIQYRNALKRDPKYGPAHYKLALVALQTKDISGAANSLIRAIELVPPDQPDHWDAVVRLADLYMAGGNGNKMILDMAEKQIKELIKHDANSFDALRLTADLNYARATAAYKEKRPEEGQVLLAAAIDGYKKADNVKPGNQGVSMQLARALAAKGDFAGSEAIYRDVIKRDKAFQQSYTELYRLFLFQQKQAEAEQVLRTAFENNPKQYGFLTLLAMHYYSLQRREEMIGVLAQIKSHAKDFDQAYLTVGDFYLRMGDADSAIKEYKEGITKDEKKKSTYQKRVIEVLMRQGKRNEAAEINSQILKENANDPDARGLAATFMLDRGDVAKALAELQAVVTRAPDNPVARFNLGRAHNARGEWEQARQQFSEAIKLRPDYILARLALAQLQVNRAEFDAALKTSEDILKLDKGNVNARLIESAALMGLKRFGDSRVMLDGMLKASPSSPDVLFQLGVVNLYDKRYQEATDAFRRTYQLNPANSRGLMGIVETTMAQNKPDDAIKILQTESDKAPNRLDLLLALGNLSVRAGKYDFAIQTFNKILSQMDKDGKPGDIYVRLGETYRRKGDVNSAIQALQKARETLPDNVLVLSTLALVLDGAQRRPEAKQVYEATLKLDPNNPVILNNLAFLMVESGDNLDEALTKAQRAKQLQPGLFEISDTLGWIYLKKNLYDQAIDIFKDLVTKQPNHSTYRYHLGMAYSQKGDKMKALEQLHESLKYNPAKEEKDKIQKLITQLG
jgi:tetratricopeptide (TPR) repeat protein